MSAPQDGTVRAAFDRMNPNQQADLLRRIGFGSLLQGQLPQTRRMVVPTAALSNLSSYNLPTVSGAHFLSIPLPSTGKARSIIHAYARTSTNSVYGKLTVADYASGSHPATGEISVAPNGDILLFATDAVTSLDIEYLPLRADVRTVVFPVVTGIVTLPASITTPGVVLLAKATVLAGTTLGEKSIVKYVDISNTLPATLTACLNHDKTKVLFNNATDAVARAELVLLMVAREDLCTVLEANE